MKGGTPQSRGKWVELQFERESAERVVGARASFCLLNDYHNSFRVKTEIHSLKEFRTERQVEAHQVGRGGWAGDSPRQSPSSAAAPCPRPGRSRRRRRP